MTDDTKEPAINQEQARLLNAVAGVDKSLDPDPAPGEPQPKATVNGQVAEIEDPVTELADTLQLLVDGVGEALPYIKDIYTPKVLKRHAIAINAVAAKYGWNVNTSLGPELGLALVAIPPAASAYMMTRMFLAAAKEQATAGNQAHEGAGNNGNG